MEIRRVIRLALLAILPVPLALHWLTDASPIWVFASGAAAVGVLAEWMKRATEQIANRAGSAIGGLLNVSFGSLAELILAVFVLMVFVLIEGHQAVVRAQITGSIIGTSLLGLGGAVIVGGMRWDRQSFRRERAGLLSSLLVLVVVALLLPEVHNLAGVRDSATASSLNASDEHLSLSVSVVLLLLYAGNLVYTLVTHRDVFAVDEESGEAEWGLGRSLLILGVATTAIAVESELVSSALAVTADTLHLSGRFLGIVVLALVGTSADLFAAFSFARQNRMGLVMSICVGSSIQMALVVAPLLVLISWAIGYPMSLVFADPLELFAIAGTVFIVNAVAADGETSWFEGLLLVGVWTLFGFAFFFA